MTSQSTPATTDRAPDWWSSPRKIHVVVDNPSWILPYAEQLVEMIKAGGDDAVLCRNHDAVGKGGVAFYLGCMHITPPGVLGRNRVNLVVHESDLPKGRGFAPVAWQILGGADRIPVCLIDMAAEVDAGDVILRNTMQFSGHELNDEIRNAQGRITIDVCLRYLAMPSPPAGEPQVGDPSFFPRRRPVDSELDPHRSIAEQFNLLRVVDNDRYPAFFRLAGHRYRLRIEKWDEAEP
ncbi:hypothetical protein [Azospirillum soli]|uniref:hypothetical protein n=1 Tax=Azospirillum soli TaxID=1304799 RepID=UPI001AE82BE7|nr:hypothetical protein [Azospirillum soli]MBP2316064.1 methionyl-tRNA formyltransferase [Azospirillum soli]